MSICYVPGMVGIHLAQLLQDLCLLPEVHQGLFQRNVILI